MVDVHLPAILARDPGQEFKVALSLLDADGLARLQRVHHVGEQQGQERQSGTHRVGIGQQPVGQCHQRGHLGVGHGHDAQTRDVKGESAVLGADR